MRAALDLVLDDRDVDRAGRRRARPCSAGSGPCRSPGRPRPRRNAPRTCARPRSPSAARRVADAHRRCGRAAASPPTASRVRAGCALTRITASLISRSAGAALSSSGPAEARICCRHSRAAASTARPVPWSVRLPWLPPSYGAISVSPDTARNIESGMPSVSAAIIASVVRLPVPMSVDAKKTIAEPSRLTLTEAPPSPPPPPRSVHATPMPRAFGPVCAAPATAFRRVHSIFAAPSSMQLSSTCVTSRPSSVPAAAARDRIAVALDVLQAERHRIPAHLDGDLVHRRLDAEGLLRIADAARRAGVRDVGVHAVLLAS